MYLYKPKNKKIKPTSHLKVITRPGGGGAIHMYRRIEYDLYFISYHKSEKRSLKSFYNVRFKKKYVSIEGEHATKAKYAPLI